ncbi:NAD(P)-dependent dehydrogenase, short-chain alcohol dehydrogenase family [Acinetobacter marinus]|uniref:NAD(P)-dependent dehydrogenase, short-chain alcohol dehydrogenase family n=1 Tax=Acinetobacter marinus TaxID=281375 RepID=A0A1G6IM37_9GAMM|nr:SDR family oxidoreductase [Acinetobacter marinus]SDC06816.1 NAD(P)-dependent dehydrogenase, short-chain alcohol dehydrogenase family [Acinetobacter marinus]
MIQSTDTRQKVALVTGGGTGIGQAISQTLAKKGFKVVIVGRRLAVLQETAQDYPSIDAVVANVVNSADLDQVIAHVQQKYGQLDVLINNAGIAPVTALEDVSMAEYKNIFDLNVGAVIDLTIKALPLLKASKGKIINISTGLVNNPMPHMSVYTASKAAVHSLTRSWAKELAGDGIQVNVVAPGPTDTPLYDNDGLTAEESKAHVDAVTQIVPLARFGQAQEVANVVAFLSSDEASYITGASYAADGGFGI